MFRFWDSLSDKGKVGFLAGLAIFIGVMFWIPFTRSVILFILPLGSGIDDLIFLGCLGFGVIMAVFRLLMK